MEVGRQGGGNVTGHPARPRRSGRWIVCMVVAGILALALAGRADAKGIEFTLTASDTTPKAGEQVQIAIRGRFTFPGMEDFRCRHMRLVVVSPGVSVRRALRSLEGRRVSQRIGEWDAFRLGTLRSTARLTWKGVLRPNRYGRWTLIIPNGCAQGYRLPSGAKQLHLAVHP